MNILAKELNEKLNGCIIFNLLSDLGKRFYFPKGIVSQSAEAKQHASRFNVTIGMAYSEGKPMALPCIEKYIPLLDSVETVSYAPTPGVPALRKLWREEIIRKNEGIKQDSISEPIVVPGLTNGIAQIADLFIDKDDSIIIPDMFWGNYRLIFEERREAKIKSFPFFTEKGALNISAFKETMKKNIRNGRIALLLNFPNNPTGYSPTVSEAEALILALKELAEEGIKILIIIDDAYFDLFYEDNTYKSSIFAGLHNSHKNILAVKIDGATKEQFVWGFRVGFITFGSKGITQEQYEALNKKLAGSIRSSVSSSSRPAQSLLQKAITSKTYLAEKNLFFNDLKKRYHKCKEILKNRKTGLSLKALPFNSGYFMSFKFEGGSAEALRKELLYSDGIGTISIQDIYLRVTYASVDLDDLDNLFFAIFAAADRLTAVQ